MNMPEVIEAIGYDCVNSPGQYGYNGSPSLEERRILVTEVAESYGWPLRAFFHDAQRRPTDGKLLPGLEAALAAMTPQTMLIVYSRQWPIAHDANQESTFNANGYHRILTERGELWKAAGELMRAKQEPVRPFVAFPGIKAIGYARGAVRATLGGDKVSMDDRVGHLRQEIAAAGWGPPVIFKDLESVYPDPGSGETVRNDESLNRPGLKAALSVLTSNHVLVVSSVKTIGSWRVMDSFVDAVAKTGAQWVTEFDLFLQNKNKLYIKYHDLDGTSLTGYDETCWFCGKNTKEMIDGLRRETSVYMTASHKDQTLGFVCRPCTKLDEQELYARIDLGRYPALRGVRVYNPIGSSIMTPNDIRDIRGYVEPESTSGTQREPHLPGPPDDSYSR